MEYRWKQYEPVNILNMELAEFDLTKTEYSIKDVEYVAGIGRCEFIKSTTGGGLGGCGVGLAQTVLHTGSRGPGWPKFP